MARPHLPPLRVEKPTGQRTRRPRPALLWPLPPVSGELILNRVPERLVHDGLVLARMDQFAVPDAADEDRILQHDVELAAGKRMPAGAPSVAMPTLRRTDHGAVEFGLQLHH